MLMRGGDARNSEGMRGRQKARVATAKPLSSTHACITATTGQGLERAELTGVRDANNVFRP